MITIENLNMLHILCILYTYFMSVPKFVAYIFFQEKNWSLKVCL